MIHLVLGGARSGKSTFAEKIIEDLGGGIYLATSQIWDDEMQDRVDIHKGRRDNRWETIEEPLEISNIIMTSTKPILVDCLTLWLTNLILDEEKDIDTYLEKLLKSLSDTEQTVVLVSNEVGLGIVPENKLARRFRDEAGRMNQMIAQTADKVTFIAAGLPLTMKG